MRSFARPNVEPGHYAALAAQSSNLAASSVNALQELADNAKARHATYVANISKYDALGGSALEVDDAIAVNLAYDRISASVTSASLRISVMSNPADLTHRCVYCEITESYQMDHFVPRSSHAEFALETTNLVPVCGRCNQKKLALGVGAAGDRLPHPYLDSAVLATYLVAHIKLSTMGYYVVYRLDFSPQVPREAQASLRLLFDRLDLISRYDFEGNSVLREYSDKLQTMNGTDLRRWSLEESEKNRKLYGPNNWKTALFSGFGALARTVTS